MLVRGILYHVQWHIIDHVIKSNILFIKILIITIIIQRTFLPISDPVQKVSLTSSNLAQSIAYWNGLLTLKIFQQTDKTVLLGFSENQAKLELVDIGQYKFWLQLFFILLIRWHHQFNIDSYNLMNQSYKAVLS